MDATFKYRCKCRANYCEPTTDACRPQASPNFPRLLNAESWLSQMTHHNTFPNFFLLFTDEVCSWSVSSLFHFNNSPGKHQPFLSFWVSLSLTLCTPWNCPWLCCVLSPSRRHHRDALGMFSAIVPSLHRPVGTLGSFPCHWLQRYWTHCHLIWPPGIGVGAAIWPSTPSLQWEAWPKPSTLNGLPCIFLDFCIGLTPPSLNMVPCQPWEVSPNLGLDMYPDIYSTAFISAAQFTETRQAIRFLSLFQHPLCIKLHGQICFA